MGKFLKYEDSNYRTFKIDTTAGTITRPNRPIRGDDMIGAIIEVDSDVCTVVTYRDTSTAVVGVLFVDGVATVLTYTKSTDSFALGATSLTNVMIDEFGRELKSL